MARFYRIHQTRDVHQLLDPRYWRSRVWAGNDPQVPCPLCGELDEVPEEHQDGRGRCVRCRSYYGGGMVDDIRRGVSVCASLDDLREYLATREWTVEGSSLVVLEGDESPDEDHDAGEAGAPLLVYPSKIVQVIPLDTLEGVDDPLEYIGEDDS